MPEVFYQNLLLFCGHYNLPSPELPYRIILLRDIILGTGIAGSDKFPLPAPDG